MSMINISALTFTCEETRQLHDYISICWFTIQTVLI